MTPNILESLLVSISFIGLVGTTGVIIGLSMSAEPTDAPREQAGESERAAHADRPALR